MTQVSRKGFRDKNGKQVVLKDPTKADKVTEATEGNLAGLDEEGNPTDSGYAPSDFAPASGSTEYAPASGSTEYAPATGSTEYAPASHSHTEINAGGAFFNTAYAKFFSASSSPFFRIKVGGYNDLSAVADITIDNIENLKRALATPSSEPENNNNKLITSKAVYEALLNAGVDIRRTLILDIDAHDTPTAYSLRSLDGSPIDLMSCVGTLERINVKISYSDGHNADFDSFMEGTITAVVGSMNNPQDETMGYLDFKLAVGPYMFTNKVSEEIDLSLDVPDDRCFSSPVPLNYTGCMIG